MNRRIRSRQRRGAMLVLILVLLIGFMATVAFSVDIAQMHLSRSELRTATDAAAKAASQELSRTFRQSDAIAMGKAIAEENTVNGDGLLLSDSDFQFGRSTLNSGTGGFDFSTAGRPLNTVRVTGRRTAGSRSGPIPLFFGNVLGFSQFEPQMTTAATYLERDVVLVVDRSGSMAGAKMLQLLSAIEVFVDTLQTTTIQENVGLASYNSFATQDVQLTTNLDEISNQFSALRVGGATSISRGMSAGQAVMNNSTRAEFVERTMIVMTDGRHNSGPEPRTVARRLAAEGVQIHTITFGSGADQSRMREVASIGDGRHFHALTASQLQDAYREIALTLRTVISE